MNPPASMSCRTDPPPEWSNQTDCRLDFGWALHLLTQFGIPWLERWDVFFSYRLGHLMATHSIIERNRQPRPFFLSAIWPRAKAAKPLPCPALRFGGLKGLLRRWEEVDKNRWPRFLGGHGHSRGDACSQSVKLNIGVTDRNHLKPIDAKMKPPSSSHSND